MKTETRRKITPARRALLAKVHIALKDLAILDEDYRDILAREFGVESSRDLSDRGLGGLVEYFESKGWKAKPVHATRGGGQAAALKERIGQEVLHSDLTPERLRGLVRKICGVDDLQWCGDAVRLKRLLAAIGHMIERGDI